MEIENRYEQEKGTYLDDVRVGECFEHCSDIYMKTSYYERPNGGEKYIGIVNLKTGTVSNFNSRVKVLTRKVKAVVE